MRRIDLSFRPKGRDELNTGRAIRVRHTRLAKLIKLLVATSLLLFIVIITEFLGSYRQDGSIALRLRSPGRAYDGGHPLGGQHAGYRRRLRWQ